MQHIRRCLSQHQNNTIPCQKYSRAFVGVNIVYLFINIIFHSVKVSIEQENHPKQMESQSCLLIYMYPYRLTYGIKDTYMHAFVFRMIFLYQINGSQIKYRNVFCLKKKNRFCFGWFTSYSQNMLLLQKRCSYFIIFLHIKKGG